MIHCRPSLEEGLDVLSVNDDDITHGQYDQGIIYTPTGGGTPPIDVNTHPQTVLPQWVCVYCSSGVFVHSV